MLEHETIVGVDGSLHSSACYGSRYQFTVIERISKKLAGEFEKLYLLLDVEKRIFSLSALSGLIGSLSGNVDNLVALLVLLDG
ncbi:MAG: hypothetical protein K2M71_05895 [Duncaniella sp.]|nr:hypothetical protein [Duncaniella sp.]